MFTVWQTLVARDPSGGQDIAILQDERLKGSHRAVVVCCSNKSSRWQMQRLRLPDDLDLTMIPERER